MRDSELTKTDNLKTRTERVYSVVDRRPCSVVDTDGGFTSWKGRGVKGCNIHHRTNSREYSWRKHETFFHRDIRHAV